MKSIINVVKKFPKIASSIGGLLVGGGGIAVSPHVGELIAKTHSHVNESAQVEIVQTPIWAQEINRKIDEKYIMTCGADNG